MGKIMGTNVRAKTIMIYGLRYLKSIANSTPKSFGKTSLLGHL